MSENPGTSIGDTNINNTSGRGNATQHIDLNIKFVGGTLQQNSKRTSEKEKDEDEVPPKKIKKGSVEAQKQKRSDCCTFHACCFMNRDPLKPRTNIYGGYQNFVPNEKLLLAIKKIGPYEPKNDDEVRHLLKLRYHPNIVQIVATFKVEDPSHELWIVMEQCCLDTLQDYVNNNRDQNRALDVPQTTKYTKHLVKGMKFIHKKGIIHGDLKPDNILFSLDRQFLKIADFGLSKQLEYDRSTATANRRDGYGAPETYSDGDMEQHSDIFSLGLVIHVLWTNGDHPYGSESDLWVYYIKTDKNQAHCDLSNLPNECPKRDDLLELLKKMLQFQPRNRPSIGDVASSSFFDADQPEQRQLGVQNCPNQVTVLKKSFQSSIPGEVSTDRAPTMSALELELTVPSPISAKQDPEASNSGTVENSLGSTASASTMPPVDVRNQVNTQSGQGIPADVSQEEQQQEDIRSPDS